MDYATDPDIANARQATQELTLSHITNLPAYPASPATACRVGRIISAHAVRTAWNTLLATDLLNVLGFATLRNG
jgi:hypothetical protein